MARETENALAVCRQHKAVIAVRGGLGGLMIAAGIFFMVAALIEKDMGAVLVICGLVLVIGGAVLILDAYVGYRSTYLSLGETRLMGHKGFLSSTTLKAPLAKIEDIEVHDGLLGKALGYGTIKITDAGRAGTEFVFPFMEHPHAFADAVLEQIDKTK